MTTEPSSTPSFQQGDTAKRRSLLSYLVVEVIAAAYTLFVLCYYHADIDAVLASPGQLAHTTIGVGRRCLQGVAYAKGSCRYVITSSTSDLFQQGSSIEAWSGPLTKPRPTKLQREYKAAEVSIEMRIPNVAIDQPIYLRGYFVGVGEIAIDNWSRPGTFAYGDCELKSGTVRIAIHSSGERNRLRIMQVTCVPSFGIALLLGIVLVGKYLDRRKIRMSSPSYAVRRVNRPS